MLEENQNKLNNDNSSISSGLRWADQVQLRLAIKSLFHGTFINFRL